MPEYHQIQATLEHDEAGFPGTLERWLRALRAVGLASAGVAEWAGRIRWDAAEGYLDVPDLHAHWTEIDLGGARVRAAPLARGWESDGGRRWVELGLLFESEQIEDPSGLPERVRFRRDLAPGLWGAVLAFARELAPAGAFLTNEASDGEPWEGLVEGDPRKLWHFDLAVVPPALAPVYDPVPPTHWSLPGPHGLALADRRAWTRPPWGAGRGAS